MITTTFAPEMKFNVLARTAETQPAPLSAAFDDVAVSDVEPFLRMPALEHRGIEYSPLND